MAWPDFVFFGPMAHSFEPVPLAIRSSSSAGTGLSACDLEYMNDKSVKRSNASTCHGSKWVNSRGCTFGGFSRKKLSPATEASAIFLSCGSNVSKSDFERDGTSNRCINTSEDSPGAPITSAWRPSAGMYEPTPCHNHGS